MTLNEASMFLHLILLILVSLDIRQTTANKALHEKTQTDLNALRMRLEAIYRIYQDDQPPK